MRTETVEIEPVDLCSDCPKRGDCRGVSKRALDTLMKVSFFTITVPEGDPDFVASRQYLDDEGGASGYFLDGAEQAIESCVGPVVIKQRSKSKIWVFRKKTEVCGAHLAHMRQSTAEMDAYRAASEAAYIEANGEPVLLTPEETRAFTMFSAEQIGELGTLSIRELNELIRYNRENPESPLTNM